MSDRRWVGPVLGVAGAAVLFGALYGLASGGEGGRPLPDLPPGGGRCVEATEWMIANHPVLLDDWRNAVVRDGLREYTATTGEVHVMSLTKTCGGCHGPREAFCARCHDYAGVRENCWNCHVEARGI